MLGLLGGNGAGKTTTIAMLLGLLVPTAGRDHRAGPRHGARPVRRTGADEFLLALYRAAARLSVAENLRVYGHLYNVPQLERRIAELAEQFNLGALLQPARPASFPPGRKPAWRWRNR